MLWVEGRISEVSGSAEPPLLTQPSVGEPPSYSFPKTLDYKLFKSPNL